MAGQRFAAAAVDDGGQDDQVELRGMVSDDLDDCVDSAVTVLPGARLRVRTHALVKSTRLPGGVSSQAGTT